MFCAASKSIEMTSRTIVKFMTITLEANMTFTHNLITHLNFKKGAAYGGQIVKTSALEDKKQTILTDSEKK